MRYDLVFGGKAGQGPNILAEVVSIGLMSRGYYVFYSRDYQSLIRGGHNFNTISFSNKPIYSNSSKIDFLVCLDDKTEDIHKKSLKKGGIILKGPYGNMYFAGQIYKLLGIDFKILDYELKKLKNYDENIRDARKGYLEEERTLKLELPGINLNASNFMNGNQAISRAAVDSGLEYYYAYPMTPATPVMMELGVMQMKKDSRHRVIELENEIAVILAAAGSSLVGARAMVGTSGGGFDLMTEGISMLGQAEIPLVIYLSSRPGPSTGLATYTAQDSINLALYSGHGEFNRLVIIPGDIKESIEATNQAFYFSQMFRMPTIILGDKHLAESKYLMNENPKILEVKNSITLPERFNSYEHDPNKDNIATEEASVIKKNFDRRIGISKDIEKEAAKYEMFKIYGNKNSKNLIIAAGSVKGAIIDAIEENKIDAKVLQIIYLDPFSRDIEKEIRKATKVMIVENNSTAQLATLILNKTGFRIEDKNKILRYDGRPFLSDELAEDIKKRIK